MLQSQNVIIGLTPFYSLDFDLQTTSERALGKIWGLPYFYNSSPIVSEIQDYFRV